jgi:hypothetical protein
MASGGIVIEVKGAEELIARLGAIDRLDGITAGLQQAALAVKQAVAVYPPETIANSPQNPARRWYERGYGGRWLRRDGTVGGNPNSEQLGKKWTIKPLNATAVVVGNLVGKSYGKYVQEESFQLAYHGQRDWKTVQTVATETAPEVTKFLENYIFQRYLA